jgi:hypothetical protein
VYLLGAAGRAEQHVLLQLALDPAADLVRGLAARACRPLRSLRDTRSVMSDTGDSVVIHSVMQHAYTCLLLAAGHAEQHAILQLALAPGADLVRHETVLLFFYSATTPPTHCARGIQLKAYAIQNT